MPVDMATLAIQVDGDRAIQTVQHFGKAAEESATATELLTEAAEGLESGMSKLRTVVGLGLFGAEFVRDTIAAQDSMAQLQAGVRSTGGAAGFTADQLRKQAYEMEELTTNTHTAVEATQSILLLFQNLSGKQFEEAEMATANLAARLKTDMPDAARQLGRALEDPAQGLLALRRAGIVFSEGQREMLKDMVLAGNQAQAQTIILDELNRRLEGSAVAARDTLGGALKGVIHDFDNLFEVTREGSSPVISTLNTIGEGLRLVKDHSEALTVAALGAASVLASRMVAALVATNAATREQIASTIEQKTVIAEATEVEAANSAFALEAAENRLRANVALGASEEELAILEQGVANAQFRVALTAREAAAAEEALAAASTLAGRAMAEAGALGARGMAAMGGPIGIAILAATLLYSQLDKIVNLYSRARFGDASQTDAQSAATDAALAKERQRNAALRQSSEAEESARIAAEKANRERVATTEKLATLNSAYMSSTGALKVLEIQLSANIDKVKAHTNVKKDEWAAIDRSIDALTREQVAQVRLAEARKATEDIAALQATNRATLTAAESAGQLQEASNRAAAAQLDNADAYEAAQNAVAHLKNQIDAAAAAQEAWTVFTRTTVGATKEEIVNAEDLRDRTIAGIEATRNQNDANADANTTQQHSNRLLAEGKQLRADMNALLASNAAAQKTLVDDRAVIDAQSELTRARFLGGQAATDAQVRLEHLQAAQEAENAIIAAGVAQKRADVSATEAQKKANQDIYDQTIAGIEQTERLKDANIDAAAAATTLGDARSRAYDLLTNFFENARNGAASFWDFFKQEAERAFAELIEKRLIDKLFSSSSGLAGLFGGIGGGGGGITAGNLFDLPSRNASRLAAVGQGIGIAGAGFGVGSMIGGLTENRALGALGGAASGAATGAAIGAMGGPVGIAVGSIIGGAAGLVGGFLGVKKHVEDFGDDLFGISSKALQIETSLADWRAEITGTAKDQAAANREDLRWKYLQLVQTIEQVEAGKKMEDQRNRDLAEAAQLYVEAQAKLTDSTNTLNQAFTGMIGEVQGYKLKLELFNYSPALGPTAPSGGSTPPNTGSQSGGNVPNDRNGGRTTSSDNVTVNINLDGKRIATNTVGHLREVSQQNFGNSTDLVGAMRLLPHG
jgi:hypothetical protein